MYGLIIDPHNDLLSVGPIAQLEEHCTSIVEVRVRIPFQAFFLCLSIARMQWSNSFIAEEYYYHFVGHCGEFYGLKWRIWRAKKAILVSRHFHTALVKEIFLRVFCFIYLFIFFFSVFIFSVHAKVTITVIRLMFLNNKFWALLRAHFNPHLTARGKTYLCPGSDPKPIHGCQHKLCCFITVIITLEDIEKVESEKKNSDNKTIWRIFISPTL